MARREQGRTSSPRGLSTPALVYLTEAGIEHSVHHFDHDPRSTEFGLEAARALGVDPSSVFKTLVWTVDGRPAIAIAPVTSTVAPKRLATALGGRRAELAPAATAERLSGSVVGAISPVGLRQPAPAAVDASVLDVPRVFISAGRRGLEVSLAPADLILATCATVAPIASAGSHR